MSENIVDLPIGNTAVAAMMIQDLIDCDLFEIDTVTPYPLDYHETTEVSRQELRQQARPILTARIKDMSAYDVVFIGYPNWWGTMPMAVLTFLEHNDFSGKIIVPFCTHEGSGMGHSEADIKKLCLSSTVKKSSCD